MKLHCLQHVPFEGLGAIELWALERGFEISYTALWDNPAFPDIKDFDWLVIMGGPMNVDEENLYPWLREEKKFIERAIKADKKVLGVCLGAQLIARVLGAHVIKNPFKEIGWLPVTLTEEARHSRLFQDLPPELTVFHWHGDTFELPKGAVRMAESQACLNQAFIYKNNVVGLQFHLESTPESVGLLMDHCADEMVPGPYIQSRDEVLNGREHYKQIFSALSKILNAMHEKNKMEHK